jgi:hypothetical protein
VPAEFSTASSARQAGGHSTNHFIARSILMHNPFQTHANFGLPYEGPYYGTPNPMASPYTAQQFSAINPLTAGVNPLAATLGQTPINPAAGIPQGQPGYGLGYGAGYGIHPLQSLIAQQQMQLAAALASQAAVPQLVNPQLGLAPQASGFHQNPILTALLTNPLAAAGLLSAVPSPYIGSQLGQQPQSFYSQPAQFGGSPSGQAGSPFGQTGPVGAGYPLAPQSWVGPGWGSQFGGQAYGQIHPLLAAQLASRALQGQAFSPWGF